MLHLLNLFLHIALGHTSLPDTLSSHLRRHADSGIAIETTHLFRQEDQVNVFEAEVRGLGVVEVDDRDEERQKDHEDQVRAPADAVDQHWRDHDDEEVPDPVARYAYRCSACACFQWQDLWSVYYYVVS